MGVLANREAAWEEAQYYFEKSRVSTVIFHIPSFT